jgi:hypothetical protein
VTEARAEPSQHASLNKGVRFVQAVAALVVRSIAFLLLQVCFYRRNVSIGTIKEDEYAVEVHDRQGNE